MTLDPKRLGVCLECEDRQKVCHGPCLCTINGQDIIQNARNDTCPKNKFKNLEAFTPKVIEVQPCGSCGKQPNIAEVKASPAAMEDLLRG